MSNIFTRHPYLFCGIAVIAIAIAGVGITRSHANAPAATSSAKPSLSVSAVVPQTRQWPITVTANGTVLAWQEAVIGAETGGLRITALHADVGSMVKRGQLLAELSRDSVMADLHRFEAAVASARASLAQAKSNADRARLVKHSGTLSDQQITEYLLTEQTAQAALDQALAQLEAQKVVLAQTRVTAVDDGLVTSRSAILGQVVSSGAELFRLQRQGRLEWQAEVDAHQLAMIKLGANAEVVLNSGKVLQGKVRLAAPTLSTSTSRANVYVSLPAGANAGMFASGRIEAGQQNVLTVPQSALVLRDGLSYVFEIGTGNKVIRHKVITGMQRDGQVEIASGLKKDARVVASGGAFLADGDLVMLSKDGQ